MNSEPGNVLGIISILVSVGGAVYAAINHKRIRCRCCGRDLDVQVDVDSTEARKSVRSDKVEVKVDKPSEEQSDNQLVSTVRKGRVVPL